MAGSYPKKIIPQRHYKYISFNELTDDSNIIISRTSNVSKEDTFDEVGLIKQRALISGNNEGQLLNFSMNLLGGKYKIEHSKFKTTAPSWKPHEKVSFNEFKDCISEKEYSFCLLFSLNSLHGINIPYKVTDTKDERKKLRTEKVKKFQNKLKQLSPKVSGIKFPLDGTGKIVHKPNKLNFWHVEFQVIDFYEKLVSPNKSKSKWGKSIITFIIDDVFASKNLVDSNVSPTKIPKSAYTDGFLRFWWRYAWNIENFRK